MVDLPPDAVILHQNGEEILYISAQDPKEENGWRKTRKDRWERFIQPTNPKGVDKCTTVAPSAQSS